MTLRKLSPSSPPSSVLVACFLAAALCATTALATEEKKDNSPPTSKPVPVTDIISSPYKTNLSTSSGAQVLSSNFDLPTLPLVVDYSLPSVRRSTCASDALSLSQKQLSSLQVYNRCMYSFNKELDRVTLAPVSRAYNKAPQLVKEYADNFAKNWSLPARAINHLLQGNVAQSVQSIFKFSINTTLGLGGIIDLAHDLQPAKTNFTQTARVWGVGSGEYVVLPLIGPAHQLDLLTIPVQWLIDPISIASSNLQNTTLATTLITQRAAAQPIIDIITATSVDEYSGVESIYTQKQESIIQELKENRTNQLEVYTPSN